MKFIDVRDENGTALKVYADMLAEKAKAAGLITVMVFVSKEHGMIHAISTMDGSPARALIEVGKSMLAHEPVAVQSPKLVSPDKAN
jgi:hypothetical protein